MSDPSAAPPKESLATRIEGEKSHPLAWKTVATRAAMVAVTGIAIYLVFPAITEPAQRRRDLSRTPPS